MNTITANLLVTEFVKTYNRVSFRPVTLEPSGLALAASDIRYWIRTGATPFSLARFYCNLPKCRNIAAWNTKHSAIQRLGAISMCNDHLAVVLEAIESLCEEVAQ